MRCRRSLRNCGCFSAGEFGHEHHREGQKTPPHVPGLLGADEARQVYGDGMFGGFYQADPTIMEELFAETLADVERLLRFE